MVNLHMRDSAPGITEDTLQDAKGHSLALTPLSPFALLSHPRLAWSSRLLFISCAWSMQHESLRFP